jgi:hypothetical protein
VVKFQCTNFVTLAEDLGVITHSVNTADEFAATYQPSSFDHAIIHAPIISLSPHPGSLSPTSPDAPRGTPHQPRRPRSPVSPRPAPSPTAPSIAKAATKQVLAKAPAAKPAEKAERKALRKSSAPKLRWKAVGDDPLSGKITATVADTTYEVRPSKGGWQAVVRSDRKTTVLITDVGRNRAYYAATEYYDWDKLPETKEASDSKAVAS